MTFPSLRNLTDDQLRARVDEAAVFCAKTSDDNARLAASESAWQAREELNHRAEKAAAPLTLPTVHSNGTGRTTLLEGYCAAMSAISDAREALSKIEFNARDYYPQGGAAFAKAREEMQARHAKLAEVSDELEAIANHIADAP